MKKFVFFSVFALLLGASISVSAQGYYGRRNQVRNEQQRIRQGVRSGQLTRDEAQELRARKHALHTERRAYRSDGVVTQDERRQLRRDQRAQSRTIYNYRHNSSYRSNYGRYHRRGNGYYRRGAGSPSHPVFGTRY